MEFFPKHLTENAAQNYPDLPKNSRPQKQFAKGCGSGDKSPKPEIGEYYDAQQCQL